MVDNSEHSVEEEEAQQIEQGEKQRPHVTESPALPFLTLWGLLAFSFCNSFVSCPPRNFRSLFSYLRFECRASQGTRPRIPRNCSE